MTTPAVSTTTLPLHGRGRYTHFFRRVTGCKIARDGTGHFSLTSVFLCLMLFLVAIAPALAAESSASTPVLKTGAHLALAGDSITEQKLYTRFIEDYLLMCAPEVQADVFNLGWSGEMAQGFFERMDADFPIGSVNK